MITAARNYLVFLRRCARIAFIRELSHQQRERLDVPRNAQWTIDSAVFSGDA